MAGTWSTFNAPSGLSADTMLLLTDGTVLIHDANRPSLGLPNGGANWYRLTPDDSGDYSNGKWSDALPMSGQRQFFSSGVLKDGRVYVVGGEYSDILGNTDTTQDKDTRGESGTVALTQVEDVELDRAVRMSHVQASALSR